MRLPLRVALGVAAAATLAGCVTHLPLASCPPGQQRLRTAQLFFGRKAAGQPGLGEAAFRKFVDEELRPRFPDGLTILDGGAQWRGPENRQLRESAKVALIVLPQSGARGDTDARIAAVRSAYTARFRQDSQLLITRPSCVSF